MKIPVKTLKNLFGLPNCGVKISRVILMAIAIILSLAISLPLSLLILYVVSRSKYPEIGMIVMFIFGLACIGLSNVIFGTITEEKKAQWWRGEIHWWK